MDFPFSLQVAQVEQEDTVEEEEEVGLKSSTSPNPVEEVATEVEEVATEVEEVATVEVEEEDTVEVEEGDMAEVEKEEKEEKGGSLVLSAPCWLRWPSSLPFSTWLPLVLGQ